MKLKSLYAAGAILVASLSASLIAAESPAADFDPAHPFAKIRTAVEWTDKFRSNKPAIDANDRFHNMTSREWADAWTKRPEGLSNEAFLQSHPGTGGTGVEAGPPPCTGGPTPPEPGWDCVPSGSLVPAQSWCCAQ